MRGPAVIAAVFAALLGLAPAALAEGATADRTVRDASITEVSGMAVSAQHPGIVWVHEDSGHPARFFALDPRGRTVARLTVRDTEAVDWEAMTLVRDGSDRPVLVAGDIGDNQAVRESVDLVLVREPARLRTATVPATRVITLRYPDGAHDAEALLTDPRTNRIYVVTKGLVGGALYEVPRNAWPGSDPQREWTMEKVAGIPMSLVTDGAFLPDGRMLLRNYGELGIYPPPAAADGVLAPMARVSLPDQPQGEALAVLPGGRAVLAGTEGARQPIQRVALPSAPGPQESGQVASATATPLAGTSPSPSPSPVAVEQTAFGVSMTVVLVALAAVTLLAVITAVVFIALR